MPGRFAAATHFDRSRNEQNHRPGVVRFGAARQNQSVDLQVRGQGTSY
jgi:hypothetical protein